MNRCISNINCSHDKQMLFMKNGYPIVDCDCCHLRFSEISDPEAHLEKVYSDDYFFNGKDGYPNYLDEKDMLIHYGIYYSNIVKKYTKPGIMLDVGSAAGFIMKGFESRGWRCYGIEPNASMASYGKNEFNLDIHIGGMEKFTTDIRFDLITLIQVIGHFYNVEKAIENVSHLLVPDGLVLVESWNMNSITARILGKHWHEYSPPSVINWFSDESLTRLFHKFGLEKIGSGLPAKRINLKHALSLIEMNFPDSTFKKKILGFLNQTVGKAVLIYPPIDLKWYVFRKK